MSEEDAASVTSAEVTRVPTASALRARNAGEATRAIEQLEALGECCLLEKK